MDVEILGMPIIRELDGLAMSSRNTYLLPEERKAALFLYRSLKRAKELLQKGEQRGGRILDEMNGMLRSEPLIRMDYIQICDADTLQEVDRIGGDVVVALAAYLGKTRLIDNLVYRNPSRSSHPTAKKDSTKD